MSYKRVIIPPPTNTGVPSPIMTSDARDRLVAAAESILGAIDFSETPEGPEFWSGLYDRLHQIADNGDYTR